MTLRRDSLGSPLPFRLGRRSSVETSTSSECLVMKKALGAVVAVVALFLLVSAVRDVVSGKLAIGAAVVIGALVVGLMLLAKRLFQSGSNQLVILREDGSVNSLDASYLKNPHLRVGEAVGPGDMLGVTKSALPKGAAKAALEVGEKLLFAKQYAEAIAAFESAILKHPETAALAAANIGACRFMLGEYQEAITLYERAKLLGANPMMMDDNIREAQQKLAA